MLKSLLPRWRVVGLIALALSVFMAIAPSAIAASPDHAVAPSTFTHKKYYLALGDSLAFGYQPNLDFTHGYVDDLSAYLTANKGFQPVADMGCSGETSVTMLNGECPYPTLRKYPYKGAQYEAALDYLQQYAGQVALVTLDIGGNNVIGDINPATCQVNVKMFHADLAILDKDLTQTILPGLLSRLKFKGKVTGQLIVMNYFDSYQNICPGSVSFIEQLNKHLASDVSGYATLVNVFRAFGGSTTPNPHICTYTWMCNSSPNIHPTTRGYRVIESVFKNAIIN